MHNHPSFYTKHASALPWGKCLLHVEALPQLVWIGITTRKQQQTLKQQQQRYMHIIVHALCTHAIRALYARIPGAAKCKYDTCKNVLRSIFHIRTTSGGQLNANGL